MYVITCTGNAPANVQVKGYAFPATAAEELAAAFPEVIQRLKELWTLRSAQSRVQARTRFFKFLAIFPSKDSKLVLK